jgi:beta-galactosidase GanA
MWQALNPLLEWSEVGPVTKLPQSAIKPDFPDTTTAYLRWYWNALEPEQGKFRWDIIDHALQEARAHGQTLAIRLMPYSKRTTSRVVSEIRARRANKPSHKDGSIWQRDFSDPFYLKYWGELVSEAGKRL